MEANTTTNKTLRPCIEESKDWDNTENLYIEGDNLEVLKLLQNSYFNKVKMIYIDPPYNTGNDFIYIDDFAQNIDEYEEAKGSFDEEGNRLFKNTDTNGRFHSDWCSMIYPRLILARNLLADDGVIFISIDDNEAKNILEIGMMVFGEKNFISQIPWQSRSSIQNDTDISINHEYIIVFAKNRRLVDRRLKELNYKTWFKENSFAFLPLPLDKTKFSNIDNDKRGLWKADPFDAPNVRPNLTYEIKNPNTGELYLPPKGRCWRTNEVTYNELLKDNRIVFGKNGISRPQLKVFYEEKKLFGAVDNTWWNAEKMGTATQGTKELMSLFDNVSYFDTPKPVKLIYKILKLVSMSNNNDIILDFFSGSATTAHAVMQLNAEDGGKRKFIMVQLPEETDEKSEAFKAGYKNICEIGKERIRRAGEKIKEEAGLNGQDLDIGFRVLKLDSSNMKDIYYSADEYDQGMLENMQSNTKEDRTDLDLLFGCLVDWGLELDKPYTTKVINGHKVHIYNDGDLVACFEKDLDMKTIDEIAKLQALRVVFCDNSFIDSATKINVAEHFKMIAPDTDIKVI